MLNVLRRSANSMIIKTLLVLLALSFGIWGVGDYLGNDTRAPLATVGAHEITIQEFTHTYDQELQRMKSMFGGKLDRKTADLLGLKNQTMARLINRHVLLTAVRDMGLTLSPAALTQAIATDPTFHRDGQFDETRYRTLLASSHLTPRDYEAGLASDLTLDQLHQALDQAPGIPDALLTDLYELENEKRSVAVLALDPAQLQARIQATEDALEQFLKDNPAGFMTPLEVKLAYVVLDSDSVRERVTIPQERIEEYYREQIAHYRTPEQRRVRHILVTIEAGHRTEAQALERIREARQRLSEGVSFSAVAKSHSDDVTAGEGGDLGSFGRGAMVPAFEEVAFSLAPGVISEPVKTPFGYHLILVEAIQPAREKPLDEAAEEIRAVLFEELAAEEVYKQSVPLEDQLFDAADLQALAKDLNLRYRETDWLDRGSAKLEGIERQEKFLEAAFDTGKGALSGLLELEGNRFAALRVTDRREPRLQTLAEARAKVEEAYRQRKAGELALAGLQKVLTAVRTGKQAWGPDAGQSIGLALQEDPVKPFTLAEAGAGAPPEEIRRAAFQLSMEAPIFPSVIQEGQRLVLVRLQGIRHPEADGLEQQRAALTRQLEDLLGQERYMLYLAALRNTMKIDIDRERLDRL
ncbi:MAG: SurA N-terminal domain-containing protein [Magnetococcales bacterium]|nr:SurA N-terminal domain-containing protein [Magnetococcales bacterium]